MVMAGQTGGQKGNGDKGGHTAGNQWDGFLASSAGAGDVGQVGVCVVVVGGEPAL